MTTRVIDTHLHLWDLEKIQLDWVSGIPALNRSFRFGEYASATKSDEFKITKSIYMEVDAAESEIRNEIEQVLSLIADSDNHLCGMIAATRPGKPLFRELLSVAKSSPEIKGFRRVLHTPDCPKGHCLTSDFVADIRRLGTEGLTFDLCIRREELSDAKNLIAACPETQFVLDHCGNADVRIKPDGQALWRDQISAIAELDNVACKVSGFIWTIQTDEWSMEKTLAPIVDPVLDCFGEDRVLFGGDWPVCTLSNLRLMEWLAALKQRTDSKNPAMTEKLFERNAERIYRL